MSDVFDGLEVAIIGMAGRYPKSGSLRHFWEAVRQGRELITHFENEELERLGVAHARIEHPDFVKAAAYLEDDALFDAGFFGILPAEAELLDPQHRLLLECAWHAFEDAGYPPGEVARVGTFAAASMDTYLLLSLIHI